jgi:hypothetical protein
MAIRAARNACEFVPEYRGSIQRRRDASAKFSTAVVLSQFRTKAAPPGSPKTALKACAQGVR